MVVPTPMALPRTAAMSGAGPVAQPTFQPVNENIWEMSFREKRRLRIDDLPHDLNEACDELEKDDVVRGALGDHIARHFLAAKRQEWREYISQVSSWELDQYFAKY